MNSTFKVGDIVRYAPEWCEPSERRYLHVIKEDRSDPTATDTRWLIQTINSDSYLGHSETVDGCMIEPTGFDIFTISEHIGDRFGQPLTRNR